MGAFFLLLDDPEVFSLPPDPVVPTKHLKSLWASTALAGAALVVGTVAAFVGGRK
jgi:formate dehydrogenase iron-sulfur subunit